MEESKKVEQVVREKTSIEKKAEFDDIVKTYLESNPNLKKGYTTGELEIRFGTNPKVRKYISKIDYDNVVKYLYHHGFKTDNINGNHILHLQSERSWTYKIFGFDNSPNCFSMNQLHVFF